MGDDQPSDGNGTPKKNNLEPCGRWMLLRGFEYLFHMSSLCILPGMRIPHLYIYTQSKAGCRFPMFFPWFPQNGWNKGKPLGIKGQGSYGMFILISFQASVVLRGPWNHLPFMSCGGCVWLQGMVLNRPHTRCGHCACTLGRSDRRLTACAVAQLSIGGTFEVLTRWYQPQQIAYKCLQNIYIYIHYIHARHGDNMRVRPP